MPLPDSVYLCFKKNGRVQRLPLKAAAGAQRVNSVVQSFTVVPGLQEVCEKCQRLSLGTQRSKAGQYSITRLLHIQALHQGGVRTLPMEVTDLGLTAC